MSFASSDLMARHETAEPVELPQARIEPNADHERVGLNRREIPPSFGGSATFLVCTNSVKATIRRSFGQQRVMLVAHFLNS